MLNTIIADAYKDGFAAIDEAAAILRNGGLVAFPTETVYGLGANALDGAAVLKIFDAKGRPPDNPLIVHVMDVGQINEIVTEIPENALKLLNAFSPGPLTLIFYKKSTIPKETSGGLETVAVRIPSHPVARKLIEKTGFPIAAPSANSSGKPSPTRAEHVINDIFGKVDMILDGGASDIGLESTVVDVTGEIPELLRPGSITAEMLRREVCLSTEWLSGRGSTEKPKSPGMKYRHYAPEASITVVTGSAVTTTIINLTKNAVSHGKKVGIFTVFQNAPVYEKLLRAECTSSMCFIISAGDNEKPETIAHNLFDALRRFDLLGIDEIYAEDFGGTGLYYSIMNRLNKAAGFNIIEA